MKLRHALWLFAFALSAVALAACGGDGKESPGTAYPSAGDDQFEMTTATVEIEIDMEGANLGGSALQDLESVDLSGPALIRRGDPELGDDDLYFIETEIVSMELTGTASFGDVVVRQSPRNRSFGEVRQQEPGRDFPADSFFDVFVEIEVADLGVFAENIDPLRMEATLTDLPPAEDDEYRTADGTPVAIQTTDAGRRVGRIVDALHIPNPAPPPQATDQPTATEAPTATEGVPEATITPSPEPETSGSCRHFDTFSVLIIRFTNLEPGLTLNGVVDGPAVLGEDTFTVTADANGEASYEVDIGLFGEYQWVAGPVAGSYTVGEVCPEESDSFQ